MPEIETTGDGQGRLTVWVEGEEGSLGLEAWDDHGIPVGVIVAHSRRPFARGQKPLPCQACDGACYLAVDREGGMAVAALLLGGAVKSAEQELLSRYRSYLQPELAARS